MSPPPNEVTIPQDLLARLNQGHVVPFLGAGCSMDAGLPSASQLAQSLVDAGYGSAGDDLEDVAEAIFATGGWQAFAQALPIAEWRAIPCTDSHVVLAELCKEGLIKRILTTNWDVLIETGMVDAGEPHSPIVRAESIAASASDPVLVIKLNGDINNAVELKARRSEVDSTSWAEDWAAALFDTIVRENSLLFIGYSGASVAATKTIEKIVQADQRTCQDFIVDIRPYEELNADVRTSTFMAATNVAQERAVEGHRGEVFFRALRKAIFPFLLQRPFDEARALLDSLCHPTQMQLSELESSLEAVREVWSEGGQSTCQSFLLTTFSSYPLGGAASKYLALIPRKGEIGRLWGWLAIASWAGNLTMETEPFAAHMTVEESGLSRAIPCVFCICPDTSRRDAAAYALAEIIRLDGASPANQVIGVHFGGVGPGPQDEITEDFSAARGHRGASVARGGGTTICWCDSNDLFAQFTPNASAEEIQQSVNGRMEAVTSRSPELRGVTNAE